MGEVGRSESIFSSDVINIKNEPGTTFAEDCMGYVVLEDGTVTDMKESTYRDLLKMLDSNRIYKKDILNNIPENQPELVISDDVEGEYYSVHDVMLDVEYNEVGEIKHLKKKRLSFATEGKNVLFQDSWSETPVVKNLNEILSEVMSVSFTLDEYFDKEHSSTKLLKDGDYAVNTIVLRLRKIDDPVSETNPDNLNSIIVSGLGAYEILNKLKADMSKLNLFANVFITNTFADGSTNSNVISFENNSDSLDFIFNEYDNDMTASVDVSKSEITIKHREFGKLSTTNEVEKNCIYMTKGIVMNSNGHITTLTKTDVEISKEINSLFYTKAQITDRYIGDSEDYQTFIGSLSTRDLTVSQEVDFRSGYEVTGDRIVMNSSNTSVKDPIISIGTGNTDGEAPIVGTVFNLYKASEVWDDNILTGATFSSNGGVFGLTDTNMNIILSSSMKDFKPEYYTSDPSLNSDWYVAEGLIELKPSKVNMLLALASIDKVNYENEVLYYARIRAFINNILNMTTNDVDIKFILEYKPKSSSAYDVVSTHTFAYQNNTMQYVDIYNSYDIDKVRLKILVKIKKGVIDNLNGKEAFISIQQLGIFGFDSNNVKLDESNSPAYTDRYYSEDTLAKADYINITNGFQAKSYKNLSDISIESTSVNIDNKDKTMYNSIEYQAMTISSSLGDSGIVGKETKMKLMHIRTLLTPNSSSYETTEETEARYLAEVLPHLDNYKAIIKVYGCMYSDLIYSLGETTTTTNEFGKETTIKTQTTMNELILDDNTLLHTQELPINKMTSYGYIDTTVEMNIESLVEKMNNSVEYYKGKFRDDSIYLGFKIELIKIPLIDRYNNYGDMMTLSKFRVTVLDVLKEFRGTSRDVVIDETVYNDVPTMFLNNTWQSQKNVLSESTIMHSAGISSFDFGDKLKLTVNKISGVNYGVYNWTDMIDNYDQRTYMTGFRFKKSINNLMKIEFKLADILFNGVSIDSLNDVKCHLILFKVNSDGTYTNLIPYRNSRLETDEGTSIDLVPKKTATVTQAKSIAEMRRIAKFITTQTTDKFKEFKYNQNIVLHYDLNSLKDDVTLELDLFIDIPINNNHTVTSLEVLFGKASVKMITDVSYKMRLVQELSSMQAMLYDKKRDSIRFIDNRFNDMNEALNVNHLSDIELASLKGFIENVQGFTQDLKVVFKKDVSGEFLIEDTNDTLKRVLLKLEEATTETYGTIGLIDEFVREVDSEDLPQGTTYTARSIYNIVSFLHKLHFNKEISIENSSPDRIATARAVYNLYEFYKSVIANVSQIWMTESTLRRAQNTVVEDLIHFEPWDFVKTMNGLTMPDGRTLIADTEFDDINNITNKVLKLMSGANLLAKGDPNSLRMSAPQAVVMFKLSEKSGFYRRTTEMEALGYTMVRYTLTLPGYNFDGQVKVPYYMYSDLMNKRKAADPYFLMYGFEGRDGDVLFVNRGAVFGGSYYLAPYANNNNHGLQHVSGSVIFDSKDVGSLKELHYPEYTTSDYIEFIYSQSPRMESISSAFSGDQDYVNMTCGEDFSMSYQGQHDPRLSARGLLYGGGGHGGGGGYHGINFVPPYYTQFQFLIQESADDGVSWTTIASETRRFFSLESYLVKSSGVDYIKCDVTKRYRIVLNILHQPLDIDSYGGAMTVGRMGELNGGFAESRWYALDHLPNRVSNKLYDYGTPKYSGKNFFRRLRVKYTKHYIEPWEQPQRYLISGDVKTDGFIGYNHVNINYTTTGRKGKRQSRSIRIGESDIPIVPYYNATDYMKRNHAIVDYGEGSGFLFYTCGEGSYWLADGYSIIPFGVSKIIPLPKQYLRDVTFTRAGEPEMYSNFMVTLELRRSNVHPNNAQEAMNNGVVVRSWQFNLVQTKHLDITTAILPEVDTELDIDPNYRYWYHLRWGKNGTWTAGFDLAGQTGIVRKYDSWTDEPFYFNGIRLINKYYIYK